MKMEQNREPDSGAWIVAHSKFRVGYDSFVPWTPHIPSEDAYRLLFKVLTHQYGEEKEEHYCAMDRAIASEDIEAFHEAVFMFAVALGESLP
jgi:hypothetical protein